MSNASFDIIIVLFANKVLRVKDIVEKIQKMSMVTEPTVYKHLRELRKGGFVIRMKMGKKNVQYKLTSAGERMARERCARSEEAILAAVKNYPFPEKIVAECLAAEIVEEAPEHMRTPEIKFKIREFVEQELRIMKDKVIKITNLNYG